MAAGEYVSVHSQADTEEAELKLERAELKADDKGEHKELMTIYVARGLDPSLAKQVAEQLMVHDALGAHARDQLGISETFRARPIQAALASAASFAVGATMPLLVTAAAPGAGLIPVVAGTSLMFLALLGGLAARVVACNNCKSSCSCKSQQLSIGASRLPIRGSSGKRQHYPHEGISECISGHEKRCSSAAATVNAYRTFPGRPRK